jgi:acyl dehydratase
MAIEFFPPSAVYVGRDVGGWRHTVTARAIARYEAGTGDCHPWYHGDSPFGGPVAPALLYHSEVYRDLSWYLPNLIGNLHARQEWELFAPLRVGQTVRTRATVVDRYRKRNRDYLVNEVLIADLDGRWLQRSRTHQSFLVDEPQAAIVHDKEREHRPDRRFEVGAGSGPELPAVEKTVTLEMCEAFSGPVKNYHTDREMARALGFPDVVVQGMMSICFVSELMTRAFGAGWYCGGKLAVNLVNVLWGGERLLTRAQVREELPEGSRRRTLVDVWSEKPDGTKTLVGTASALHPERGHAN